MKFPKMLVYILTYIASAFFCELGFREKRKFLSIIVLLLAVVIPAFVAGMRDETMGTDRLFYGDDVFRDVCKSADFLHLDTRWEGWIETGYIYFSYAVSLLTHKLQWYYFFLSLVENVFVILAIWSFGHRKYAGLAYLAFLFCFFQPAFNMIRQALALSMLLFAAALYTNKKIAWAFVLMALAYFVHHSSIVFLSFPLIDYLNRRYHNVKVYLSEGMALICVCVIAGRLLNAFAPFLDVSISRYRSYFTATSSSSFSVTELLFAMMFACLMFFNYSRLNEEKNYLPLSLAVIGLPLSQIGFLGGEYISRVSCFFLWLQIPVFASVVSVSRKRPLSLGVSILYIVLYWFYHYIYQGWHQTYPYTSKILGL